MRLQVVCFSTICQCPVHVLTGKVLKEHFIRLEGFIYNVIKMTCFTVQFLIVNTIVLSVKEAVESMLKHPWYIYFDDKPKILNERTKPDGAYAGKPLFSTGSKTTIPCCDINSKIGRSFSAWLQSTTGGGKHPKQKSQ